MKDLSTSMTSVAATALWTTGFLFATIFSIWGVRGMGVFAILVAGAGGCLTIRRFLLGLEEEMCHRERNAFQAGLDAQRIRLLD